MELIFDVKRMTAAIVEMEYDIKVGFLPPPGCRCRCGAASML
jgi:hypothetical protein